MVSKLSKKKIFVIFIIFLSFGCSGNRFKDNWDLSIFSFGFVGHDAYKFCRKKVLNFADKYPNDKNPSKTCIHYQYYTCHITHYCPNLSTEVERKKCEHDAAQYWTPNWKNAGGNLEKKVEISKKVCDSEAQKNSQIPIK